ncbi:helix-turn-helix domain-containing protein [Natrialba sp. PRR66]|uniref:helix-turn-helix domain-containing protein n=1 Tax=Natrialba sp. PRR66 TaxID=3098146 RepID=UPI002B1D6014|nr:helix-turn-helix domain-containing protein [Natrialba sp. PRR66]
MNEADPTFVRRKFTITERLDQTLQEMAARHYQGNVSLCLRAAIESHRETLEGDGQFAARQVARQLDLLQQGMRDLQADLDDVVVEMADEETEPEPRSAMWGVGLADEMQVILDALDSSGSPLRLEDLLEQSELNPPQLQKNLARLVDLGFVVETTDGKRRYGHAGQINSSKNQGGLQ